MDAILLHGSRIDFRKNHWAKDGQQMDVESSFVVFQAGCGALPLGDDFKFFEELTGSNLERLSRFEVAGATFSTELIVPVLGKVFCMSQTFFFGADSPILACEIRRALPMAAVGTLVDVEFASHEHVLFSHRNCAKCVRPVQGLNRVRDEVNDYLYCCFCVIFWFSHFLTHMLLSPARYTASDWFTF